MKNYYKILEVSETATSEEIEKSYERLTSKYQPESFTGEARTLVENKIEDVKEAYSILSDEFLRFQYDKEIGIARDDSNIDMEEVKRKRQIQRETEEEIAKEKKLKEVKSKPDIGTAKGVMNVSRAVFDDMKNIKLSKPSKKSVIALLLAILVFALIVTILWFLPFTHEFMRSFLLMEN